MPYFGFRSEAWQGCELLVSRTGYTGELGFELYVPAGQTQALWEALLADERVKPVGLGARDTLWKPACPSMATSWTRTTPRPRRAWAAC